MHNGSAKARTLTVEVEIAIFILLLIICTCTLAALIVLIVLARRLLSRDEPHTTQAVLSGARTVGRGRILTVEIVNPLEVAAANSWIGGFAGNFAPSLVTKIVYEKAAKIMQDELGNHGVEAVVEIRSATAGATPKAPAAKSPERQSNGSKQSAKSTAPPETPARNGSKSTPSKTGPAPKNGTAKTEPAPTYVREFEPDEV